jgi:uncharacterized protein
VLVVDTNILIYGADRSFTEHPKCRDFLESLRSGPAAWYSTWGIFYEFLRVATHPRVLRRPWTTGRAWAFLEALLASPTLGMLVETSRHAEVARQTFDELSSVRGNLIHDAHTAILMREHGIRRISTRDSNFHRFPFLEVVDPLA